MERTVFWQIQSKYSRIWQNLSAENVESKMYLFSDEKVQREKGNLLRNCKIECIVDIVAQSAPFY